MCACVRARATRKQNKLVNTRIDTTQADDVHVITDEVSDIMSKKANKQTTTATNNGKRKWYKTVEVNSAIVREDVAKEG